MAFFNALSKSLAKTGQGAVQKTKDATEVARITREIDRMEGEISILYSKIGIQYYKNHANDPMCESPELIREVTGLRQAIAESKETIKRIRGIVKCPNCSAEVPNNALFCGSCGFRMPRQDMVICTNCNSSWPKGTLFCSKCGSKMGDGAQPKSGSAPARKLCTQCGAVLMPGTLFCASCGAQVDASEKVTVSEADAGAEDSKTMYSIEMNPNQAADEGEKETNPEKAGGEGSVCAVCGTKLEDDDLFCPNCGNRRNN